MGMCYLRVDNVSDVAQIRPPRDARPAYHRINARHAIPDIV